MHHQLTVLDLAEIEPGPGDWRVLLSREEVELAEHRGGGDVDGAAEGSGVRLVGVTREDPEHLAAVARHDRLQLRRVAKDEGRIVVSGTRQTAAVMEHDDCAARRRSLHLHLQLVFQPGELRHAQRSVVLARNHRVEHDHPQPIADLAVAVRLLAVCVRLSQDDPAKGLPVVVVAEGEQHGGVLAAKRRQQRGDRLIARGGAVVAQVAADDDERRGDIQLLDTRQHVVYLPHRVNAVDELPGRNEMQITQVQKRGRCRQRILRQLSGGQGAIVGDESRPPTPVQRIDRNFLSTLP
jgi:hypothetical protein